MARRPSTTSSTARSQERRHSHVSPERYALQLRTRVEGIEVAIESIKRQLAELEDEVRKRPAIRERLFVVARPDGTEWEILQLGDHHVCVAQGDGVHPLSKTRSDVLELMIESGNEPLTRDEIWKHLRDVRKHDVTKPYVGTLAHRMAADRQIVRVRPGLFQLPRYEEGVTP